MCPPGKGLGLFLCLETGFALGQGSGQAIGQGVGDCKAPGLMMGEGCVSFSG